MWETSASSIRGIRLVSPDWELYRILHLDGTNTFFGYYDLQQLRDSRALAVVIPREADKYHDPARLGYFDLETGAFTEFTRSNAWNWQQGCRLRWNPFHRGQVYFNDLENGQYICRLFDIDAGKALDEYGMAFYDISPNAEYGLSLNYSRLETLRPGYGYCRIPDTTVGVNVPGDDGIFLFDLAKKTKKLIISYEQLVALTPEAAGYRNYINHISFSPDGRRFLFFHLWTEKPGMGWRNKLYVADFDGSHLTLVEKQYTTSHYDWINGHTLLTTTCPDENRVCHFLVYDLRAGTRKIIDSEHLHRDGHPSIMKDGIHFIADTYPNEDHYQELFEDDTDQAVHKTIAWLYSDPGRSGEFRCDLHPRLTQNNQLLSVDSTFRDQSRGIVFFRRKT